MSINALHSWVGIVFGCLLFIVFLTGTLTVFDNEMTRWMQPPDALRVSSRDPDPDTGHASILFVKLQSNRTFSGQTLDPETGGLVTFRDTQGGDFFYHFHHGLLLGSPGAWMVGTAGIAMLVTLLTGLGIRRRDVKDVLVFRPWSFHQRTWFDIHNVTGVLVLPFHLIITFSGLMIFWSIYMPTDLQFFTGGDRSLSLLSDLHFAQFGGSTMRWLYFLMGLAATAMIGTGLILWTNKRRKYSGESSDFTSYRFLEALNAATVAGLLVAIPAYFWANRVLPLMLRDRSLWEMRCFFVLWCCAFAHSLLRRGSLVAWKEQLYAAAVLPPATAQLADNQQSCAGDCSERGMDGRRSISPP
ncbi:MAG TPA: PepSY-associated TM helix domain-containing protein [Nitrospira sp.]|nr:PepSY-associated TM helix domain-containing protein [Nitrospira sp.]